MTILKVARGVTGFELYGVLKAAPKRGRPRTKTASQNRARKRRNAKAARARKREMREVAA